MAIVFQILKQAWLTPGKDVKESFEGRNVIVTGATTGLGVEAAAKYALLGASKVIIAARDPKKGEKTKAYIEKRTGRKHQLEIWPLDLASYESVVAFAKRANELDHLDIAVLNAGVRRVPFVKTAEGWEEDLQVNTLSTVLLGILLLPKLKETRKTAKKIPVLEFVNSGLHKDAKINPEALAGPNIIEAYNGEKYFSAGGQYSITKLFLMYATNKLAAETSSGEVIITSICPGIVATDLGRDHYNFFVKIAVVVIAFIFMRTPEQGSRTVVSGSAQNEKLHGRFWKNDEIQPVAPSVAGEENRKIGLRVWNEIIEALSRDVPAVREPLAKVTSKK